MITHVKSVSIYVSDQGKSLAFYTEKLGFEVRKREKMGAQGERLELAPPGAETLLVLYPKAMFNDWPTMKAAIHLQADDAVATHAELAAKGVPFSQPPRAMAWGVFAVFADPDGNKFTLVGPPAAPAPAA